MEDEVRVYIFMVIIIEIYIFEVTFHDLSVQASSSSGG